MTTTVLSPRATKATKVAKVVTPVTPVEPVTPATPVEPVAPVAKVKKAKRAPVVALPDGKCDPKYRLDGTARSVKGPARAGVVNPVEKDAKFHVAPTTLYNRLAMTVDGIEYPTAKAAAHALKVKPSKLRRALRAGKTLADVVASLRKVKA